MQCQRAVWPLLVVVAHVDAEDPLELSAVEDEEPIEAFAPNGAGPALDVRVRVRRPHRCSDHPDSVVVEESVEAAAELVVAVVDQQPRPCPRSPRYISRLRACCSIQTPSG